MSRGLPSGLALVAVFAVVCSLAMPPAAGASSVRVPADYFGINFQAIDRLDAAGRDRHLSAIEGLGISTIRVNLSWQVIEPQPPSGGVHAYDFSRYDPIVADAARHGITVDPTIVQTPSWNTPNDLVTEIYCNGAQSQGPLSTAPYADLAETIAARYGRGGSFWRSRPELPARPFSVYEIWNEENLNGGWCPTPDPAAFANMFIAAGLRIHAVDPAAKVVIGGLAEPVPRLSEGVTVGDFLGGMEAAAPTLDDQAAAVAIHTYPQPTAGSEIYKLQLFRAFLRAGGIPDATPMVLNEIGWPTNGVNWSLNESQRSAGYTAITKTIPRTNCNVSAVLPHTWSTPQQDPGNPEDWFGIADPVSGAPTASAQAYSAGIRLQRGELKREAPRKTITACFGMPLPDQDREGVPDQNDYFPLVAAHAARRKAGGRLPAAECSVRLTTVRARINRSRGADRRKSRRAYARLIAHCAPCAPERLARLRTIEARVIASPNKLRVNRRSRHIAALRRCRSHPASPA